MIARRIRDVINSPQMHSALRLTAALSDGEATGTASTSNRVNLFGAAVMEQSTPFAVTETTNDGNRLRDAILGSGLTAVGNSSFAGSSVSAGFFDGGAKILGMQEGILLTTGNAQFADDRNVSDSSTGRASGEKDVDLDAAFSVSTQDSSSLEFEFEFANGVGGDLFLNFVFASEEYRESIGRAFADAVAVFLDEDADGIDLRNLAVTPSPPSPVSIDTINASLNPELYRDNAFGSGGSLVDKFGYDGFTVRLQATAKGLGPGPHR